MKFHIEGLKTFAALIKELALGLRSLDFSNNFESFEASVDISATSEVQVRNQLKFIPSRYIIVSQTGNGLVTKGTTDWDLNYLYLYNHGTSTVNVTIIFLR